MNTFSRICTRMYNSETSQQEYVQSVFVKKCSIGCSIARKRNGMFLIMVVKSFCFGGDNKKHLMRSEAQNTHTAHLASPHL